MKRILAAVLLAAFALPVLGAPSNLAQSDGGTTANPWARDHNFIAPAP